MVSHLTFAAPAAACVAGCAGALWAEPDGSLLSRSGAPPICLDTKPVLRALLACLIDARRCAPGRPVLHAELVGAVWPEQRTITSAVINRLRVAVTALRKLGLGPLLVAARGGYLLDPAIPLDVDGVRYHSVQARP